MDHPEIILIYDGECPACNAYSRFVRVHENVGKLKIINAREKSETLDEITALGIDIDQGMVLKMGDQFYYGSDAMHKLALISSRFGLFNRLNYWIFKSKFLASLFYPMFRSFRNLLLMMLGKTKINNLGRSNKERF